MDLAYVMSDFLPSETRTNPDLTGKYDGQRQCTAVERWLFLLSYRKRNRLCRISKRYGQLEQYRLPEERLKCLTLLTDDSYRPRPTKSPTTLPLDNSDYSAFFSHRKCRFLPKNDCKCRLS